MFHIDGSSKRMRSTVDDCVDRLLDGATVVVDTHRLSHLVADAYNRSMSANGLKTWPSPEVYTFGVWLSGLWTEFTRRPNVEAGTLLSSGQTQQIWENVIAEDVRNRYKEGYEYLLWHITATANQVKDAYGLMRSYKISVDEFSDQLSDDAKNFRIWLKNYQLTLSNRNCVDPESLADEIRKNIEFIVQPGQPAVVFAGFDCWTPQCSDLIDSLQQRIGSIEILEHRIELDSFKPQCLEFSTTDEEIDSCARWARIVIDANPEVHRVGIAASNLREISPRLSRKLSAYLNPDAVMEDRQPDKLAFHMTLGPALSDVPIVADAMNLLELIRPEFDLEVMRSVLLSDRIKCWDQERAERSRLADDIYSVGGDRLSIDDFVNLANRRYKKRCVEFLKLIKKAKRLLSKQPETADYAHWGGFFMDWIKNFQSTKKGDKQIGQDEFQAYQSWASAVEGLAELGFVSRNCRVETALAKLIRTVSESSIQPRAIRAPVQVGEYLAMAGQSFTHLWLLGMNEKSLPGSPHPNPFIPISLQKQFSIPGSSAAELNEQVRRRYQRLVSSAEHVVQSYAVMDGGEHHLRSFLLTDPQPIDLQADGRIASCIDYGSIISDQFEQCKHLFDWSAPALDKEQTVSGGTALLKDQSRCPFSAFAKHRLKLWSVSSIEIGVSRLARGIMMHHLAELIYKKFSTRKSLAAANDSGEIEDAVKKLAWDAANEFNSNRVRKLSQDIVAVEVGILAELAEKLIQSDLMRSEDYETWAVEHQETISLAGLTLNLKIDRIDRIDCAGETGLVLFDYKTGNCNIGDAVGDRPKDPQLVIYAVAIADQGHSVRDVGYIQLKNAECDTMCWDKYAERSRSPLESVVENVKSEWPDVLASLASDYSNGEASADPLKDACDYCHLSPVCRISDRSIEQADREN